MSGTSSAYGLWPLLVINVAVFIIFAFSFTHPRTGRDRCSFFGEECDRYAAVTPAFLPRRARRVAGLRTGLPR